MHPLLLEVVAIVGGTVHTMEAGAEPAAATVIVRDGRIEAVLDPAVPAPADARVIDAKGRHLVPGLIDGMVYFDADHDALYIAQGVTTIRDLGGDPVSAFLGRLPDRRNRVPGPALVTPGTVIDGDPPSSSNAVIVRSADVAPGLLQILLDENVDFFSVQLGLPADALARTIELAHEHELEVWGPLPRAVTLGFSGLLAAAMALPLLAWRIERPGVALLGHAVALAGAVALLGIGSRVLLAPKGPARATPPRLWLGVLVLWLVLGVLLMLL